MSADAQLTEQVSQWQSDLDARHATLSDAEQKLADAERDVREVDERLTNDEHSLVEMRRHASALSEELHGAQLRFTELPAAAPRSASGSRPNGAGRWRS